MSDRSLIDLLEESVRAHPARTAVLIPGGASLTYADFGALSDRVRRMFQTLGVWEGVASEAQPILDMVITDSRLTDAVRPTFLSFAGEKVRGSTPAKIASG